MFHKILVAYDGSAGAEKALATALALAQAFHGEIWALTVENHLPHFAATVGEVEEAQALEDRTARAGLAAASARATQAGLSLHCEIRAGHVVRTLLDFLEEEPFDVVVLGHSGQSEVWNALVGSTAERVSRHAPCTVIIAR